jgi:ribose transport system substrate-binding protein
MRKCTKNIALFIILIIAIKNNEMHGLVVQNPFKIGYSGVINAVAYLRGESYEKRIDTGAVVVTPDNINEPEINHLLSADYSEFLH